MLRLGEKTPPFNSADLMDRIKMEIGRDLIFTEEYSYLIDEEDWSFILLIDFMGSCFLSILTFTL